MRVSQQRIGYPVTDQTTLAYPGLGGLICALQQLIGLGPPGSVEPHGLIAWLSAVRASDHRRLKINLPAADLSLRIILAGNHS